MQLTELGKEAAKVVSGRSVLVVSDSHVAPLYLETAAKALRSSGFSVATFIFQAGEAFKTFDTYLAILHKMAELPLTRTDCVVALGGGVVGDVVGFAAATYLRGIAVLQVPTSLLAMVDSSIGGKTAVNLPMGKNLVGAFHLPSLILRDYSVLQTLPPEIWLDGMGEVLKYGVLCDKALFEALKNPEALQQNPEPWIERCVRIKEEVVEKDVLDRGLRQTLNLGHTLGHALEIASNFSIGHGSAVAWGLWQIALFSAKSGWCDENVPQEIAAMLTLYGFPTEVPFSMSELYQILLQDKKRKGDSIDLVIPEAIGRCTLRRITLKELEERLCE